MLGHNRPPADPIDPLRERLDAEHAWILDRMYELLSSEASLPETVTDDNLWRTSNFVRDARACVQTAVATHKAEKEEFLTACRTCDDWLKNIKTPLLDAIKRVELKNNVHLVAKLTAERAHLNAEGRHEEAEKSRPADLVRVLTSRGTTTLKAPWAGVIEKREELDLEKLRPYLPLDALEQALRLFVRAGGRELRGCRIFEDIKSMVTG